MIPPPGWQHGSSKNFVSGVIAEATWKNVLPKMSCSPTPSSTGPPGQSILHSFLIMVIQMPARLRGSARSSRNGLDHPKCRPLLPSSRQILSPHRANGRNDSSTCSVGRKCLAEATLLRWKNLNCWHRISASSFDHCAERHKHSVVELILSACPELVDMPLPARSEKNYMNRRRSHL